MPTVNIGNLSGISFASLTFASYVTKISPVKSKVAAIDVSKLTSTKREYIPGKITDFDALVVEYQFDCKVAPVAKGTTDTVTVTLGEVTSAGNPATLVGSGFVEDVTDLPNVDLDGVMMGSFTWRFDGNTGPTWTAETDS